MAKSILVGLSTSSALAAHRTHHSHAMNAHAAVPTTPSSTTGGVSSSDRALYIKNEHDSGYNPKNNFNANGTLKTQ
jgi:hypothetical protein